MWAFISVSPWKISVRSAIGNVSFLAALIRSKRFETSDSNSLLTSDRPAARIST